MLVQTFEVGLVLIVNRGNEGGGRSTLGVWKNSSLIDKTDSLVYIFHTFKYHFIILKNFHFVLTMFIKENLLECPALPVEFFEQKNSDFF